MSFKLSLLFLSALSVLNLSCGKTGEYANSGTTNTYNFIYFGNFGSSTLNAFYIDKQGVVTIASNSISTGSGTSSISDLQSSPDGKYLYAANKSTNNVSWYAISPLAASGSGQLTYQTLSNAGSGASGIKIHPSGKFGYVTNSSAISNNISFYTIDQTTGAMNLSLTSYTARTNPWNLALTPTGNFLFVINRGTSDISSYTVSSGAGTLNLATLSTPTGTNPEDLAIHPNGNFLYTLSAGTGRVYMHRIGSGASLTALTPAFIATGSGPKKIVITPNGKYVFVSNNTDNTISTYNVDTSTGLLTNAIIATTPAPVGAGVYALGVTPESTFLTVSGDGNGNGYIYQIEDATGMLTQIGGVLTLGANPRAVKIVPLSTIE